MTDTARWILAAKVPEHWKTDAIVVRIPGHLRKRKLLGLLARQLHFPSYFGHNWDALEECLRDLSWLPAGKKVVLWHQGLPLARHRDDRVTYLEILRGVADRTEPVDHPVQVVLPSRGAP